MVVDCTLRIRHFLSSFDFVVVGSGRTGRISGATARRDGLGGRCESRGLGGDAPLALT